jgi:hypothetical protein
MTLSDALESSGAKIASTVEVAAGGVVTVRAEMPPAL